MPTYQKAWISLFCTTERTLTARRRVCRLLYLGECVHLHTATQLDSSFAARTVWQTRVLHAMTGVDSTQQAWHVMYCYAGSRCIAF